DRERVDALGAPLRAASATAALIDRDAVWTAKRAALEIIATVPLDPRRDAAFEAFRAREGEALDGWATWCALAELHGPDWRTWPPADADRAHAERVRAECGDRIRFHAWLQWLAAEQ